MGSVASVGNGWSLVGRILTILVLLACALGNRRVAGLAGRVPVVAACAALSMVGALAVGLVPLQEWEGGLACAVLLTAGRLAATVLWLAWIEQYARLDPPHVIVAYTAVHVLSSLAALGVEALPAHVQPFVAAAMPVLSGVLLTRSPRIIEELPYAEGEKPTDNWAFPVRAVVLSVAFALCNLYTRTLLPSESRVLPVAGVVVACALLLVVIAKKGAGQLSLNAVCGVAFLLTLAGLFGTLRGDATLSMAASLATNAGFALFSVYLVGRLCGISFRYGVSALVLFGLSEGAGRFAGGLGTIGADVVAGGHAAVDAVTFAALCALVLGGAYVWFVNRPDNERLWGASEREMTRLPTQEESLDEACLRLSRAYGLTRREEDTLRLLARDCSASEIAQELCVSQPTVKTHTQAVYRKLGVHSRLEVVDLAMGRMG